MAEESFNFLKYVEAKRQRIRERHIPWREQYGDKSGVLKQRFEKIMGHGSYWRWEGHDVTTNSDYFVVVGPAIEKTGRKSFFAGIKKMPPKERRREVYAPSGKYFPSIMAALSHASEMWGTPVPKGQTNYTRAQLGPVDIPRHIKG